MWFEKLTGFQEKNPKFVRENLKIDGEAFLSKANNERFFFGYLDVPTLEYLRLSVSFQEQEKSKIQLREVVADVQELHNQPENSNAIFQAASQFNLLEMISPEITPEQGIDRYDTDYTQGPACAVACGAGTIYRNYFAKINGQLGQTSSNQIDCLDLIGNELMNNELSLWTMKNGYALVNQNGILTINNKLAKLSSEQREKLKGKLKIGIQWNTEVTISKDKHKVSQVYCSALPVAYSHIESFYWENFARLILEATYEATLYASLINMEKYGFNLVYLTLVGGGVFQNEENWILESLEKAITKFKYTPLDIRIVSYKKSNPNLIKFIKKINNNLGKDVS